MPKAVVIGAQGTLGAFVANELKVRGWDVLRTGRRPESARDFRRIDLSDRGTWGNTFSEAQLIISTVPHEKLLLEQHVIEAGGLLLSPATVPRVALEALEASQHNAQGVVIPHAGLTPGLSNLLAADLLEANPDAVELAVGLTFKALGASGQAGRKWVFRLFAEGGVLPVHGVRLPAPLGSRLCVSADLSVEGWFSSKVGPSVQRLEFCIVERSIDALLRGLSSLHLTTLFSRVAESAYLRKIQTPTDEQIYQWVWVRQPSGAPKGWLISATGDYRSTAIAVRIFAEAACRLHADSRLPRGLVRLQEVLKMNDVRTEFAASGISILAWTPAP
jgi:hypothetical protein